MLNEEFTQSDFFGTRHRIRVAGVGATAVRRSMGGPNTASGMLLDHIREVLRLVAVRFELRCMTHHHGARLGHVSAEVIR
jgi:hypothetical protein